MHFKRTKCNCSECPLRDREPVVGQGSLVSKIVLIGEAPGREEDENGKPFIGKAGDYLNYGLRNAEIRRENVYFTNVILCRPPKNNIQSEDALKAIQCCKPGFEEEISFLRAKNTKVFVPLGNTAKDAFGIEEKISKVRGSVYHGENHIIIPTYHPSGIMRNVSKKSDGSVAYMKFIWIADLAKAKECSEDLPKKLKENFLIEPDLNELKDWCAKYKGQLLAVDIETWRNQVSVIGIAADSENALSVPLIAEDGSAYWYNGQAQTMRKTLNDLFNSSPLMYQNGLFDIPRLQAIGFNVPTIPAHDTLLLNHAISPELPHNLGFIVSIHGKTPYWKDRKDYRINHDLWVYNLRDCVVLHQVLPSMLYDLKEMNTEKTYYDESLRLIDPILSMMRRGLLLDKKKLRALKKTWESEREKYRKTLTTKAKLPESFNLNADEDLRYFFFGIMPGKFDKLSKLQRYDKEYCEKNDVKALKTGTKIYETLLNLQKLRDFTKSIYRLKVFAGRRTPTGKMKVDVQNLARFKNKLTQRLELVKKFKRPTYEHMQETKNIERLLSWLVDYFHFTKYEKLATTYTKYTVDKNDQRVHTSLLIHGTASGRLSSRDPNLQNVPSPKKDPLNGGRARGVFVPAENSVFLSLDYSNLEVRVLAYVANDTRLITAFENGINIHDMNTTTLFGLTKNDPMWKIGRRAAKIFMFGGISYLGGDNEIFEKISIEVPELPFTLSQYKKAKENYMKAHPEYSKWVQSVKESIDNTRTVSNAFGRKRVLMGSERDIYKEGVNHMIQSTAAGIINQATIRIHEKLKSYGDSAFLVLQVHDELIVECYRSLKEKIASIMKTEMEKPVLINGVERLFPVDAEIGNDLGHLRDFVWKG